MTKLTEDRIPEMKPREKLKKKLGLLSSKKRRNMTMRFQYDTLDRFEKLLDRCNEAITFKISRTDIVESLVLDALENRTNTELKKILLAFGKCE